MNDYDIIGLCETHWKGSGHFKTINNNAIYFSGHNTKSQEGVALIISKKWKDTVLAYNSVSSRIMTIKLNAKPICINIVQLHVPTSTSTDEEIEDFYKQLETTVSGLPSREITIIQGDFNSKIGKTEPNINLLPYVGGIGLGVRNNRGDKLLEFCSENNLTVATTFLIISQVA